MSIDISSGDFIHNNLAGNGNGNFGFNRTAGGNAPGQQENPTASGSTSMSSAGGSNFMMSPGQLQGFAPSPYQDFGAVPYVNPTYMDPASASAALVNNGNLQPWYDQYSQQLQTALQPTFAKQKQDLNSDLAARGIFSSGAGAQAGNELAGQQAAALANPLGQMTQQFAGYQEQNALANQQAQNNINVFNAQNKQQANEYNATAGNDAANYNADAYGRVTASNEQNYNNFLNELYQGALGQQNTLENAWLGSYEPNYSAQQILGSQAAGAGSLYGNVFGNSLNAAQGAQNGMFNDLGMIAAAG